MIDYFALLGQPRRPWLDLTKLEEKYREHARTTHPDQSACSADEFAELNKAYRTLRDPKSRLEHLLALEGKSPANGATDVPDDLVDLFMKIAPAVRSSDQNAIGELLGQVGRALDDALHALQALNLEWSADEPCPHTAKKLYRRLSFLTRWKELLAERHMFI